jgi:hypothetical protein
MRQREEMRGTRETAAWWGLRRRTGAQVLFPGTGAFNMDSELQTSG